MPTTAGRLRFASQVKALLAGGKVSRDPEPAGWVGYCSFRQCSRTLYDLSGNPCFASGFDALGGSRRRSRDKTVFFHCRYVLPRGGGVRPQTTNQQLAAREALLDSVRHHLVADVPVGAFLSSGINSGALVGLMRDAGQRDIQTVTVAFEEFRGKSEDEAPIAAEIAAHYGTRHTTRIVTEARVPRRFAENSGGDGSADD